MPPPKEETDIFLKIVQSEGPDRSPNPSSTSSIWSPWSSEQWTSPINCADDWVPGKHYSLLLEMEEGVFFGPKNATPSQVVIKVRTGAEKRSFFGSLKRNLLLREGIESNPGPVTIAQYVVRKVYFSAQPNNLKLILNFQKYYPIEHIFVPACSSVRKIHFFKF